MRCVTALLNRNKVTSAGYTPIHIESESQHATDYDLSPSHAVAKFSSSVQATLHRFLGDQDETSDVLGKHSITFTGPTKSNRM